MLPKKINVKHCGLLSQYCVTFEHFNRACLYVSRQNALDIPVCKCVSEGVITETCVLMFFFLADIQSQCTDNNTVTQYYLKLVLSVCVYACVFFVEKK